MVVLLLLFVLLLVLLLLVVVVRCSRRRAGFGFCKKTAAEASQRYCYKNNADFWF